ncbi:MAG: SHOCT domain-containing protein [Candidatus Limnocylindrales bacterium]
MMYGWDYTGAGGWFMLVAIALIAVAVIASVWLIVHRPTTQSTPRSPAEDILRERFARGEITQEQFEAARKALS